MATEQTRERWLERARDACLKGIFGPAELSLPLDPDTGERIAVAVSCSWPTRGAQSAVKRTIGQCHAPSTTEAGRYEVTISPWLEDVVAPMGVLSTLVHELCHAVAGVQAGHKGRFVTVMRAVGLEGKPTATTASAALVDQLERIAGKLGPYPHRRINGQTRRKQGTRLVKVSCPLCGYVARITRVWIAVGLPTCPCGCLMAVEDGAGAPGKGKERAA